MAQNRENGVTRRPWGGIRAQTEMSDHLVITHPAQTDYWTKGTVFVVVEFGVTSRALVCQIGTRHLSNSAETTYANALSTSPS